MTRCTGDADYNVGEVTENVPSPLSDAWNYTNYYSRGFRTRTGYDSHGLLVALTKLQKLGQTDKMQLIETSLNTKLHHLGSHICDVKTQVQFFQNQLPLNFTQHKNFGKFEKNAMNKTKKHLETGLPAAGGQFSEAGPREVVCQSPQPLATSPDSSSGVSTSRSDASSGCAVAVASIRPLGRLSTTSRLKVAAITGGSLRRRELGHASFRPTATPNGLVVTEPGRPVLGGLRRRTKRCHLTARSLRLAALSPSPSPLAPLLKGPAGGVGGRVPCAGDIIRLLRRVVASPRLSLQDKLVLLAEVASQVVVMHCQLAGQPMADVANVANKPAGENETVETVERENGAHDTRQPSISPKAEVNMELAGLASIGSLSDSFLHPEGSIVGLTSKVCKVRSSRIDQNLLVSCLHGCCQLKYPSSI
ncbi:unnamed protein product [Protopolystoma xenopodis]|uniref:Uncharacterized protein n=1 Tax=Protopolystoma xenopodis TaxID=117903 RepID=A0A448WHB7_9PLAT|nr:unnamed protein product [Protopolystoma xenopodis]